jgi:hypothetical protein
MKNCEFIRFDALSHVMKACVNMLCAGMMLRIFGQSLRSRVVEMKRNGFALLQPEFSQQPTKPNSFFEGVG